MVSEDGGKTGKWKRAGAGARRLRSIGVLAVVVLMAAPVADDPPNPIVLKATRAGELVRELRAALSIDHEVEIGVVAYHPLVFSVQPVSSERSRFILSMERGFLQILEEDELRAALAHELGHVWIFTNHPYLHTERLANEIGLRAVERISFEKVYRKLWAYEGTSGVDMERLLGPAPAVPSVHERQTKSHLPPR